MVLTILRFRTLSFSLFKLISNLCKFLIAIALLHKLLKWSITIMLLLSHSHMLWYIYCHIMCIFLLTLVLSL